MRFEHSDNGFTNNFNDSQNLERDNEHEHDNNNDNSRDEQLLEIPMSKDRAEDMSNLCSEVLSEENDLLQSFTGIHSKHSLTPSGRNDNHYFPERNSSSKSEYNVSSKKPEFFGDTFGRKSNKRVVDWGEQSSKNSDEYSSDIRVCFEPQEIVEKGGVDTVDILIKEKGPDSVSGEEGEIKVSKERDVVNVEIKRIPEEGMTSEDISETIGLSDFSKGFTSDDKKRAEPSKKSYSKTFITDENEDHIQNEIKSLNTKSKSSSARKLKGSLDMILLKEAFQRSTNKQRVSPLKKILKNSKKNVFSSKKLKSKKKSVQGKTQDELRMKIKKETKKLSKSSNYKKISIEKCFLKAQKRKKNFSPTSFNSRGTRGRSGYTKDKYRSFLYYHCY